MPELDQHVERFDLILATHPQFERHSFTVGELNADSHWPWGSKHGVYCFVVDGEVVYVGRALGRTIGQRLWDQLRLRSTTKPEWKQVVTRGENRVEVFAVDREWAFLGAALEAYLIEQLAPRFNRRVG